MTVNPLITIIMPAYNVSRYIEEAIESIRNQSCENWELIVVDDCSTDNTRDVVNHYISIDGRIRLHSLDKNTGGAYIPRITAARLANTDYIITIDADDKVSPDLVYSLLEKIKTGKVDLAIPEMWRFNDSSSYKILPDETIDTSILWKGKALVEKTLCKWSIPMAGFAIRRDIYLKADSMISQNDMRSISCDELLTRWFLTLCDKVAFCNAIYYYRINMDSVTHSNYARIIESKMQTCDGLIRLTESSFGEDSSEYLKAVENKLFSVIDCIRIINNKLDKAHSRKEYTKFITGIMRDFNFKNLRKRISPRYYVLMHLPIPAVRIALKILDPIYGIR